MARGFQRRASETTRCGSACRSTRQSGAAASTSTRWCACRPQRAPIRSRPVSRRWSPPFCVNASGSGIVAVRAEVRTRPAGRRGPRDAADAAGRRVARAAGRDLQRRQPAAGAWHGPHSGAGGPCVAWRAAEPPRAAVAHRVRAARPVGRSARPRDRAGRTPAREHSRDGVPSRACTKCDSIRPS